jgi:uncharacterized protein
MQEGGSTAASSPTTAQERILALDALRGVAVLGILLMNIIGFGLPHAYTDPSNAGGTTGADLGTWIITSMLFEGTMRGLFTLLFGAGVVLYTRRLERAGVGLESADLYFRRTMWLIVFGLVNAYLLAWHGDILYAYGIAGLLLYVFRHLSPRRLLAFAIPLLCVQTVMGTLDYVDFHGMRAEAEQAQALRATGAELTEEQQEAVEAYEERLAWEKPPADEQAEHVAAMRAGYTSAVAANAGDAFFLQTDFFLMLGLWECLGMMLLGMALLKSGALTAEWTNAAYFRMLVLGWTIGLAVNALEVAHQLRNGFEVQSVMTSWYVTYDLGRIPLTLGHLAFIMLLLRNGVARRAFQALAGVGRMALTHYLAQSVICLFVFTGAGLALFGQLDRHQLYFVVLAIWAAQLAWSPWWLARYRFGPMEWLWRSLTRWERQPLRLSPALSAAPAG